MSLSAAGRRRKGHKFLGTTVAFFREHGFPGAVMTAPGDHADVGDIAGVPAVVECKNHNELNLGEWATQAERAAIATHRYRWLVVAKRRGKPNARDAYAVMPLWLAVELLTKVNGNGDAAA